MYEVTFEQVETGRTHQVGGQYVPIADQDGNPETEYVLAALVNGHRVPLQTFSVGYVEHMVGRDDTAVDGGSSSSSSSTASTPATDASTDPETERQQLLARLAELDAQTGASASDSEHAGDTPPQ